MKLFNLECNFYLLQFSVSKPRYKLFVSLQSAFLQSYPSIQCTLYPAVYIFIYLYLELECLKVLLFVSGYWHYFI